MPYVLIILFILTIILVIYLIQSETHGKPETRGKIGEYRVRRIIGKTIENEQYVINDLILTNEDMTCQIDHVVINPRGIFVI